MSDDLPLPATLTDDALDEFIVLMKEHFLDKELSRDEMAEQARKLLRLVQITYRPIPKQK